MFRGTFKWLTFLDKVMNLVKFDSDDEDYEQDLLEDIPSKPAQPENDFHVKKVRL